jgi:hypothetical protein
VAAISRFRDQIPAGAVCAAILCDRGERYLDTIYSEVWVERHFGDIAHLWGEPRGQEDEGELVAWSEPRGLGDQGDLVAN